MPPAAIDVFYPIVPDADWIARLVPLGVRTVQLRLKEASHDEILRQIAISRKICAAHWCTLIVNDYWREAIESKATFLHLGQEDLAEADLAAIRKAGLKLGVSTHSPEELDIALAAKPDYVALGPVYETKLKIMKWAPQGLERVGVWKKRIAPMPLVGIAGINLARVDGVLDAGADSCAVVTDFLTAPDPEARVRDWLAWANGRRRGV
jgi:thiamine-phosphate pyrophosphorylase